MAIVSEWLFLNGRMGPLQIVGALAVILSIILLQRDTTVPEPIVISE